MLKRVQFRDYQEQTADDHNNGQAFAQATFDTLVADAVTSSRRYAGFAAVKTGQVEVTVAAGRVYDPDGKIFARETAYTANMTAYLAAASTKIVALSAFGGVIQGDEQEREFLINAATGATEPQAVSMSLERVATLALTSGAESADPQPPAIPASHVMIAHIYVNTTGVTQVIMIGTNEVISLEDLDARMKSVEDFRAKSGPRIDSLSADLADLANQLRQSSSKGALVRVMEDLARVKAKLRFPSNAAGYGASFFLLPDKSDTANVSGLGYNAKIEEGVRFADDAMGQSELALFSANDPNARMTNGLLLPTWEHALRLYTGDFVQELGIAQYGYQTIVTKTGYLSRSRIRYGGSRFVCSNGVYWDSPGEAPAAAGLFDYNSEWLPMGGNVSWIDPAIPGHYTTRYDTYWQDTWKEPYMYAQTVDQTITGALVAQTMLIANDMWATRLGFFITAKGANENIRVNLVEVVNGQPDVTKTIYSGVYPHASIVAGWNRLDITPTFLAKGKRVALILVSAANHKIGMTSGNNYVDGTFFYSTDGQYFLGDLTKDMMVEVWGARFNASQVAIEFAALSLSGGIRDIDILASMWEPDSTDLVWEVRPNGAGNWLPLTKDLATILSMAPPLCQFRARFVGTQDMMPGIRLTGSRVTISRPKTAFKHISTVENCPSTTNIVVKALLEGFDNVNETVACTLRTGGANTATTQINPATTVTTLLDAARQRYERTWTFTPGSPITAFRIVFDGTTPTPTNTFHIAERTYYVT